MTQEFYSIITNIGLQKIQEALADGTKLDLKYIAVGDSNGKYYEPELSQTKLKNEKYRTEITELTALTAKALIPASVGGFYLREFGIFDSENNLLLVGKQPETYKPLETEGSFKELWIKVVIAAINAIIVAYFLFFDKLSDIGLNFINAIIVGILGVPGAVLLILLKIFCNIG